MGSCVGHTIAGNTHSGFRRRAPWNICNSSRRSSSWGSGLLPCLACLDMEGTMSEVFLLAVVVLFPLLALGLVVAFHRWLD